jgi:hypothetical protein
VFHSDFSSAWPVCQHRFNRSKSTRSDLLTCRVRKPLVSSKREDDAVSFEFCSAFDLESHSLILRALYSFCKKSMYNSLLRNYVTGSLRVFEFLFSFSLHFRVPSGFTKCSVLGSLLFMYLSMLMQYNNSKFLLFANIIFFYFGKSLNNFTLLYFTLLYFTDAEL